MTTEWPFDRPPPPPEQAGEITTAAALASFHAELSAAGYQPDDALALVFIAAKNEIRKNGLAVRPTPAPH